MNLYIEGHEINQLSEIQYIMVNAKKNVWGNKLKCTIDVGQNITTESSITDSSGNPIPFQSEVDVMNYLFHVGWIVKTISEYTNSNGIKSSKILFVRKAIGQ